ncbi:MAG: hypothetical protein ABIW76_15065 [Fibrobacteria bacterium]
MWYPRSVTTPIPGQIWLKSSQVVRWRMRGLLKVLPARVPPSDSAAASASHASFSAAALSSGPVAGRRIAYLFAGTYGDFVQILIPLKRLAAAFPAAELLLYGGDRYARDFASELPAMLRIAPALEPMQWCKEPVDLLFTNCVGVYRVRFDFLARFCARRAFGFRHAHETHRGGFAATLPLDSGVRSFAAENLRVLDLAGVDPLPPSTVDPQNPVEGEVPAWGKGKVLFHIGSAGLKQDFGLKAYTRLVLNVLGHLERRPVEVVMGPGDEDVAVEIRARTGFNPQIYPLPRLIRILQAFEGTVLCFNSFPAHICHYLGRPAIVMHREAVPYGYDCAPLHTQVILKRIEDWDLAGVWEALQQDGNPASPS